MTKLMRAAQCWPNFTEAMRALGVSMHTTDEQIDATAAREAPKAAAALGCETDAEEFAEAMRAFRDDERSDYVHEMMREHGPFGEVR